MNQTAKKTENDTNPSGGKKNQPVHEVRFGAVKAVVWANPTKNGVMHNVTLARIYKDADGNWCETTSFARDDLLVAAEALRSAFTFVHRTEQERSQSSS